MSVGLTTSTFLFSADWYMQWNPTITDTFGEQYYGLYTEVAFVERLFCMQTVHLGPGCLPGRYIAAGLYSEVVVNRGSTLLTDTDYTHCLRVTVPCRSS